MRDETRSQLLALSARLVQSGSLEAQKVAVIIAAACVASAAGRLDEIYYLAVSLQDDIDSKNAVGGGE